MSPRQRPFITLETPLESGHPFMAASGLIPRLSLFLEIGIHGVQRFSGYSPRPERRRLRSNANRSEPPRGSLFCHDG